MDEILDNLMIFTMGVMVGLVLRVIWDAFWYSRSERNKIVGRRF